MPPYPFSYFSNILSPRRVFTGRRSLKVWQRLVTTFFLISLLVIPASLQVVQLQTYPLDTIFHGIYEPLTDEMLVHLQTAQIKEGRLEIANKTLAQVTFGETRPETEGYSYQFASEKLTIRKDKETVVALSYHDFRQNDFQSKEALTKALSRNWFQSNRFAASLFLLMTSSLILSTNFFFLLLGATFILFLISRTKFFDFKGFGQCYTFVLNALGLPTLIACLCGLFQQPIANVLTIQNVLFVLLLVWVFFKTRFKDAD